MSFYFAAEKDLNFLNPESHKIFRKLVEEIKIGIFMADSKENLFYVNRAFVELFDFNNSTDALGKNWAELLFTSPDDRRDFLNKMSALGVAKDVETTHVRAPFWQKKFLLISANHILNDKGDKIGTHGFVANMTERRKLEEALAHKHQKIEQILDFCNQLGNIYQIKDLAQYIVKQTAEILDARRCSLMTLDEKTQELYVEAACGLDQDLMAQSRVRLGAPVAGVVAEQAKAVLVHDIEYDGVFKLPNKKNYEKRSFMSAPLVYNQHVIGVLNVCEKQGRFEPTDLKVLESIAQQSVVNLNKTKMLSAFEQLSHTDPMTGLYNYRSFAERIEEEINRARRYHAPLSIMMIDVDNFKTFNDSQGHPEGDRLLKKIAAIFKENMRATEMICRYGGDEFGIILPQTDSSHALLVGEKVRELVRQEFAEDNISISIGVAQYQSDASKEDFVKQADIALYESKKKGRNKVSAFKEDA